MRFATPTLTCQVWRYFFYGIRGNERAVSSEKAQSNVAFGG